MSKNRLALMLLLIFLPFWIFTAFFNYDFNVWLAESLLAFMGLVFIYWMHRRDILSKTSYVLIFIYFIFAKIGVMYGFENVPVDPFVERLFGFQPGEVFGLTRNHYDRYVHFLFGLLFYLPVYQLLSKVPVMKSRGWLHFFTFLFINAASAIYEIIEMGFSWFMTGDAFEVYLANQRDVLDAPKDMGMALVGILLAMGIIMLHQRRRMP